MRKVKRSQQCCANTRDGDRCDRYCKPGQTLCSVHQPNAKPQGIIAIKQTNDIHELLRRLTKDSDPAIRLRAIEAILKWEERKTGCASCQTTAHRRQENDAIIDHATEDQRAQLRQLLAEIGRIKTAVLAYIAAGGTPRTDESVRQETNDHGPNIDHHASTTELPHAEVPAEAADASDQGVEEYEL